MTNMKSLISSIQKTVYWFFTILIVQIGCFSDIYAQDHSINGSIAKYRKGELIVNAKPGDKVTVEQLRHEFWFGCAIANSLAGGSMSENDLKQYKEKFLQNFNSAVTENAVKWGNMERQKGKVNYDIVDAILNWTEENHIPLRGHNLFWGIPQFVQPWIKELDDNELRQTLQNRAETVTRRYKGRFVEYDLNNEMIHGNYYEDRLGPEITKLMAQWAHNGDPDVKLWLNDYDILTGNRLTDYMAQIRKLRKQGVPIAGIGVQGHLHTDTFDRTQLKNALDSLAVFNLPVRITEFNMPGQRSKYYKEKILVMTTQEEEMKAKEIVDYYKICFAHPAVEGILMWGFWEGANWIPVSSLYKRDWSPTPAATAYQDLIFKEWWTRESGTAGKEGVYTVPAFFGKYKVTVNGVSKEVDLTKAKGKVTVDFKK
jgi:GH35 family endo-1,4-beta-xylanase